LKRRNKNDSIWVVMLSMLYTAGLGGIALLAVAYFVFFQPAAAAPNIEEQLPPTAAPLLIQPTQTAQGVYYLPTITPNPHTTKIVFNTPTPFVLGDGQLPRAVGYSVAGRPIEVYTFGKGAHQRMIVAGIHGGYEWNTIALADELIRYLYEHPETVPADVTLYVLRNMNPDGDARAHDYDGRVNDNGVDLNRNFPTNWTETWDRNGCWDYAATTGGDAPGSEPETRAVMGFLQSHRVEVLISYHSAALGVFPGGEPWEEESTRFAKALAKATGYPFPPIDTGCVYTGTLADYAVESGAVSVDMELSTHKYTDFSQNLKALKTLLTWEAPR